jgi:Domain of unknown function (DUF5666)
MKKKLTAVVMSMACAVALLAHGGAEHVMGLVKAIGVGSVTVETVKHEMVMVLLTPKTEVLRSNVKSDLKLVKVGDRVVIHATKNKAGKLEASELEFGPQK